MDVDATLVGSHSEKENAKPTFKRGFGFHPLCVFVDHGALGTGEPLQIGCGPGTPARTPPTDHIAVVKAALKQLPGHQPGPGRAGRCWSGSTVPAPPTPSSTGSPGSGCRTRSGSGCPTTPPTCCKIPENVWTPAYDAHDQVRDGAWVAELTDLLDLTGLAERDAGDRPQRTTSPRRAAAADRHRRAPRHRVRDQHRPRAAAGSGAAAPPPRPRRRPHPGLQGHRPDEPAAARLRPRTRSGAPS